MLDQTLFVTTDLFEASTPGEHFINPRCFGENFAAWLRIRFQAAGYEAGEPIQEDWGWVLLVKCEGHTFTLAIGVMDASIGVVPAEWRVGLAYERMQNGIRSWFRAEPATLFAELFERLRAILAGEPRLRISEVESESSGE